MLNYMEGIGLVLGTFGGLILVIPEQFERYCFCWCINLKAKGQRRRKTSGSKKAIDIEELLTQSQKDRMNNTA